VCDSFAKGTFVTACDDEHTGTLTGARFPCQLAGCTGTRLTTKWPAKDGERARTTHPCTKGMIFTRKHGWRIL